jgi:hypothetical protein
LVVQSEKELALAASDIKHVSIKGDVKHLYEPVQLAGTHGVKDLLPAMQYIH